ncbi:MAG: hypothetical protein R2801_03240 [Chitinophagales bacterium]
MNNKQKDIVEKLIDSWKDKQLVDETLANKLKEDIAIETSNWRQLAFYAFVVAIVCIVLSIVVFLADEQLRFLLEKILDLSNFGIAILQSLIAILLFFLAKKSIDKRPQKVFTNASLLIIASFFAIIALSFYGKAFSLGESQMYGLFLFGTFLYVLLYFIFKYKYLWVIALLFLYMSYAAITVQLQRDDDYFLRMNVFVRCIPFSMLLIFSTYAIQQIKSLQSIIKTHFITNLILLLFILWQVSLFGNYNQYEQWLTTPQLHYFPFAIISMIVCTAVLFYGWKKQNELVANIGLIFLVINLLSRYFEYFWKPLHKSVFFIILGIIFAIIGWKAEKLWNKNS